MACHVQNLVGFFDFFRLRLGMPAKDVLEITDHFPKLLLQNRQDLLEKKYNCMLKYDPNLTKPILRNLFKRHPDLWLTSHASMEAKCLYIKRTLNRNLAKEQSFPLLLHYNYTDVIWPRSELMQEVKGERYFDLGEVFGGTDEEFCKKFGFDL